MTHVLKEKSIQYNFQPDFLARQKRQDCKRPLSISRDTCTSQPALSFINPQPPEHLIKSSKLDWCYSPYTCRSEWRWNFAGSRRSDRDKNLVLPMRCVCRQCRTIAVLGGCRSRCRSSWGYCYLGRFQRRDKNWCQPIWPWSTHWKSTNLERASRYNRICQPACCFRTRPREHLGTSSHCRWGVFGRRGETTKNNVTKKIMINVRR